MLSLILAGGEGSRLWPLSTPESPKAFLKLFHKTLLEETVARISACTQREHIFISVPEKYVPIIRALLPDFPAANILTEPVGRNTGPCVALAARRLLDLDRDAVLGVFPSDHIILNPEHFIACLKAGEEIALTSDRIVLFGVEPHSPQSAYGYIVPGRKIRSCDTIEAYLGRRFIEKPGTAAASKLIESDGAVWNTGIYIGRISTFIKEIHRHMPEIYDKVDCHYLDEDKLKEVYGRLEPVSFDRCFTERLNEFVVLRTSIQRMDAGNFKSMYELLPKDAMGNAVLGSHFSIDSRNNLILSEEKPIASIGMEDMLIINTPEVILICPRCEVSRISSLRKLVRGE